MIKCFSDTSLAPRGCLCNNREPSFLLRLAFNWRTISTLVTAQWSRGRAKNQMPTNQNSNNSWCQIVSRTIRQRHAKNSSSSHRRCAIKKVVLKSFANSQVNTCVGVSFLIKLQAYTFFLEYFQWIHL